jgi:hypothetical protein
MDNPRRHNIGLSRDCIGATKAQRLTCPPYSPERAPSHFFFFGHIKAKLPDFQSDTWDELKTVMTVGFNGIAKETPWPVFEVWIKMVQSVTQHGGEYYHQ